MKVKDMPPLEDIMVKYFRHSMSRLFPPKCKNKSLVYFIGFFHLLGAIVLQYAPWFLPPDLLWTYFVYALANILSYIVFNQECFMTLLTNYFGKVEGCPLHVRMSTALLGVSLNLLLCIIGMIYPPLAPINIIKKAINP
jgi:hypothetical protein